MNPGNLQSANGRLQDALDMLLLAWENARDKWRDQQAERFEEEHLRPLREQINITCPSISHMAQLMGQAVRECEE